MTARVAAVWRVGVAAPILALLVGLASAPAVMACRCVAPEPIAAHATDPTKAVIVGGIMAADDRGVTVLVENWLSGPGGGPIVTLRPEGFTGGEAGCGAERPPVGSRWILVLFDWLPGGSGLVNGCTPRGDLATSEGQSMLAEAVAAFGPGSAPVATGVGPGTTDPAAPAEPSLIALGAGGAVAIIALLAAGAVALRRRESA